MKFQEKALVRANAKNSHQQMKLSDFSTFIIVSCIKAVRKEIQFKLTLASIQIYTDQSAFYRGWQFGVLAVN